MDAQMEQHAHSQQPTAALICRQAVVELHPVCLALQPTRRCVHYKGQAPEQIPSNVPACNVIAVCKLHGAHPLMAFHAAYLTSNSHADYAAISALRSKPAISVSASDWHVSVVNLRVQ